MLRVDLALCGQPVVELAAWGELPLCGTPIRGDGNALLAAGRGLQRAEQADLRDRLRRTVRI